LLEAALTPVAGEGEIDFFQSFFEKTKYNFRPLIGSAIVIGTITLGFESLICPPKAWAMLHNYITTSQFFMGRAMI